MPYRIATESFGTTQSRIAGEGPQFTGGDPTLIAPQNFISSLEAASSFSVENLSEKTGVWIWFTPDFVAPTLGNPATAPIGALYFPPGTVRDFPYQGDYYSGYINGLWASNIDGIPAGTFDALTLNIIKSLFFCNS